MPFKEKAMEVCDFFFYADKLSLKLHSEKICCNARNALS